jgi:hypothetical protein
LLWTSFGKGLAAVRFRLKTLLMVLAVAPPLIAIVWLGAKECISLFFVKTPQRITWMSDADITIVVIPVNGGSPPSGVDPLYPDDCPIAVESTVSCSEMERPVQK